MYLFLTIVCSSSLLLIFRALSHFKIKSFPVIVINYFVCILMGAYFQGGFPDVRETVFLPWFPYAFIIGSLFISIFFLVSKSTEKEGVTVTAVAFKLSVVIPIAAAFVLYNDTPDVLKIAGIVLAIPAIYLSSKAENDVVTDANRWSFLLPLTVFLGSGICDAIVNYAQEHHLRGISYNGFLIHLFGTAAIFGIIALIFQAIVKGVTPSWKAVVAGVILGIPNYGSIYFMIKALEFTGIQPSAIWPINNIGTILFSALMALVLFREHISRTRLLGMILAIVAILLILLA